MGDRNYNFPVPKNELYYYNTVEGTYKPLILEDGLIPVKLGGVDADSGALPVTLTASDIMQPVEIQSRIATTIQTHNGVTVSPNGNSSNPAFVDANGFNDIAITVLNDSNTAQFAVTILWSNDGVNVHGAETVLNSAVAVWSNSRSAQVASKARYFKIILLNSDTANPHIMSAWAYLKA